MSALVEAQTQGPSRELLPASETMTAFVGPEWVRAVVHLPEREDLTVEVKVELVGLRYEVTDLRLSGGPLDAEVLRSLPLRTVVRHAMWPILRIENLSQVVTPPEGADRGPQMSELRNVSHWYRISMLLGEAPTLTVAKNLKASRSTASRRIAEARAAGFLGENEVGTAGGATSRIGRP